MMLNERTGNFGKCRQIIMNITQMSLDMLYFKIFRTERISQFIPSIICLGVIFLDTFIFLEISGMTPLTNPFRKSGRDKHVRTEIDFIIRIYWRHQSN